MMVTKSFEEGGYIYVETPTMVGWHKCGSHKEFFANHDTYDGSLDDEMLKWVGPKIPADITKKLMALSAIRPHTEVMVVLYYNTSEAKWLPHVPKQYGTAAHVAYDDEDYDPPSGYVFFGTVHTHPNMGAFWSGTDRNDQKGKPGLHVVLGLREGKIKDVKATLFYNGEAYDQAADVLEMPEEDYEVQDPPEDWVKALEEYWRPANVGLTTCRTGAATVADYFSYIEQQKEHFKPVRYNQHTNRWEWDEWDDLDDPRFNATDEDVEQLKAEFYNMFSQLSIMQQYEILGDLASECQDEDLENCITAKYTEMELAADKAAEQSFQESIYKGCLNV